MPQGETQSPPLVYVLYTHPFKFSFSPPLGFLPFSTSNSRHFALISLLFCKLIVRVSVYRYRVVRGQMFSRVHINIFTPLTFDRAALSDASLCVS